MNDTEVIISLLNVTERAAFISHLEKRNKRSDTKNIQLFNALIKGQSNEVKSQMTTNAYHVLKKRLTDRMIDFTAGCIIETEQTAPLEIMKILVLSQKLFKLKHFKTAFKQLKTAESKAKEISDYHSLNEIYQTYILYSYHTLSPLQTDLFEAYEKNKTAYSNYANLNMVYALVRKAFENQEQQQEPLDLDQLITKSFQLFGITNAEGYTFQTLNQIAEIADITGSHKRNYFETDLFFEKHIRNLQGSKIDTEKQLTFHIKLLYLIAHIYFRKKQFKKSIQNLKNMTIQMERYNKKYYLLYEIRHTTLMALNYNFSGNHVQAAVLLDELLSKTGEINFREKGILQAILARTVIHFQQEEFTEAKQMIVPLLQQDRWYIENLGLEWLINKKFIEILIAIELEDTNYVDSLISSLLRKRNVYFKGANSLALPFLKLIETYHKNPQHIKTTIFETQVESSFDWKPSEEEDLFFMSYYAWLKSKMTQKPLYKITLSFLEGTN
jgi:hypothetical protein